MIFLLGEPLQADCAVLDPAVLGWVGELAGVGGGERRLSPGLIIRDCNYCFRLPVAGNTLLEVPRAQAHVRCRGLPQHFINTERCRVPRAQAHVRCRGLPQHFINTERCRALGGDKIVAREERSKVGRGAPEWVVLPDHSAVKTSSAGKVLRVKCLPLPLIVVEAEGQNLVDEGAKVTFLQAGSAVSGEAPALAGKALVVRILNPEVLPLFLGVHEIILACSPAARAPQAAAEAVAGVRLVSLAVRAQDSGGELAADCSKLVEEEVLHVGDHHGAEGVGQVDPLEPILDAKQHNSRVSVLPGGEKIMESWPDGQGDRVVDQLVGRGG